MKSIILLLVVLPVLFSSCCDYHYFKMINNYNSKGEKIGRWILVYEDSGEIKELCKYNKGIKHGKYFSYYKSRKIESKGKYVNGKKEGNWFVYDSEGNILRVFKYKQDSITTTTSRDPANW